MRIYKCEDGSYNYGDRRGYAFIDVVPRAIYFNSHIEIYLYSSLMSQSKICLETRLLNEVYVFDYFINKVQLENISNFFLNSNFKTFKQIPTKIDQVE